MVNATVTNGALNVSTTGTLGNRSTINQVGGTWTATNSVSFCGAANNGGSTASYSLSNGVFQQTAGTFTLGFGDTTGQVYMAGTQRVFQVPSLSISQVSSITNAIAQIAGGVDITGAATANLSIASNGVIALVYAQDPAVTGMYWGLRWLGTNHVAALTTLHTNVPPRLTWDASGLSAFYTNQGPVGIYTGSESGVGYTYVGFPVTKVLSSRGSLLIIE